MSSSEYLSGYHIPLLSEGADNMLQQQHCNVSPLPDSINGTGNNGNRFVPPGRQDGARPAKRKLSVPPPPALEKLSIDANKPVIYPGRDESYPEELNKLIKPMSCELCKAQMTSMKSARDHYESKAHDRHISAWLAKNYTDVGLEQPPIKRLIKQGGPIGPNAFHCDLCDLALTSTTHARQHYTGRKHKLVEQKKSKPSGVGYYSEEGKWVRTGTKLEPTLTPNDGRFGIGEMFVPKDNVDALSPSKNELKELAPEVPIANPDDSGLNCELCKIQVTSRSQMKMHLDGTKHQKNLRNASVDPNEATPAAVPAAAAAAINPSPKSDNYLAMYRTPTGSYYCKLCNKQMNHVSILQQHITGKKHIKMARQQQQQQQAADTAKDNQDDDKEKNISKA